MKLLVVSTSHNKSPEQRRLQAHWDAIDKKNQIEKEHIHIAKRDLFRAAKAGNTKQIEELINRRRITDLSVLDSEGYTPIMRAAENGHLETVKLLRNKGAQLHIKNKAGHDILTTTALKNQTAIVDFILANCLSSIRWGNHYELTYNCHIGRYKEATPSEDNSNLIFTLVKQSKNNMVMHLLTTWKHQFSVYDKDKTDGNTVLHIAVKDKNHTLLSNILEHLRPNPNKQNKSNHTPLHIAINQEDVLSSFLLIIAGADIYIRNANNLSALDLAKKQTNIIIQSLCELIDLSKSKQNKEAQELSPQIQNVINHLFDSGDYFNNKSMMGFMINFIRKTMADKKQIQEYIKNCELHFDMAAAAKLGDNATITALVTQGAKVNGKDSKGKTAIFHAARTNKVATIEHLISLGAIVSEMDNNGTNIIHESAYNGSIDTLRFLLKNWQQHLNVHSEEVDGYNALHYAAFNGQKVMVAFLLKETQIEINKKTKQGQSPLYLAARAKHPDTVRLLLQEGAILSLANAEGIIVKEETADAAALLFNLATGDADKRTEETLAMLQKGLNARLEQDGNTALHLSILNNNKFLALCLVLHGARMDIPNHQNKTPFELNTSSRYFVALEFIATYETPFAKDENFVRESHLKLLTMLQILCNDPEVNTNPLLKTKTDALITAVEDIIPTLFAHYKLSKTTQNQNNKLLNEALLEASKNDDTKAITELFLSGASIHATDANSYSPLLIAAANGHIHSIELLLNYGAGLTSKDHFGNNMLLVSAAHNQFLVVNYCLTQHKDIFNLTTTNFAGQTVLLLTAQFGHVDLINNLLKCYVLEKINAETQANLINQNALLIAVKNNQYKLVVSLLSSGWDIHAKDADGNTALHLAIQLGNDLMAAAFIMRGANQSSLNNLQETPRQLAEKLKRQSICSLMDLKNLSKDKRNQAGHLSKKAVITLTIYLYSGSELLKEKVLAETIYKFLCENLEDLEAKKKFNIIEQLEKYKNQADPQIKQAREEIFAAMNSLYNDEDVLEDLFLKEQVDEYLKGSDKYPLFQEYIKINHILLEVVREGRDVKTVQELLDKGANINFTSASRDSAFYLAYHHGWIHLAEFIFNKKPKIAEYHKENAILKMSHKYGFLFLKTLMEIEARSKKIGNKASNLYQLTALSKTLTLKLFPSFKIRVPELLAIEHKEINEHLLTYFPEFSKMWNDFVIEQQNIEGEITKKAEAILEAIRNKIINLFKAQPFVTKNIEEFIAKSSQSKQNRDTTVVVRSTGRKEDTLWFANPGGNESISAVPIEKNAISEAIGKVLASYLSIKSLKQRLLNKNENITETPFFAVFIQFMIGEPMNGLQNAAQHPNLVPRSGVMYTGNAGCRIQVAPGHGELIVNSKGAFDTYFVTCENVVHAQISPNKQFRLIPFQDNINKKRILKNEKNSKFLKESPALSTSVAVAIAEIGRNIEEHYGIPMDIEFVFEPQTDTLNLVQARPIPNGELSVIEPSSVSPNKLSAVKAHAMAVGVISPAGNAARIITHNSELKVFPTIDLALKFYLAQKNSPIKVVIIEVEAPETSHEVAQFNCKGIPVIHSNMARSIENWLLTEKPVIIIDPQRKQMINWTNNIKVHANAEKELFDPTHGILKKGYFESSTKPQETLLYGFGSRTEVDLKKIREYPAGILMDSKSEHEKIGDLLISTGSSNEAIREGAFAQLLTNMYRLIPNTAWTKTANEKSYTTLLSHLNTLKSGFDSNNNIKEQMDALNRMMVIFCRMAKSKAGRNPGSPHQKIFLHALITGLELSKALKKLFISNSNSIDSYAEYYEILSRLEAIVKDSGNEQTLSNSVYQIVRDRKQLNDALKTPKIETLPKGKMDAFLALHSFKKLTLNKKFSELWSKFALECCRNTQHAQMLAHIVKFTLNNGIAGDWVNLTLYKHLGLFQDVAERGGNATRSMLTKITDELKQTAKELETSKLLEIHKILETWSQKDPRLV